MPKSKGWVGWKVHPDDFDPSEIDDPKLRGKMPKYGKVIEDDGCEVEVEWHFAGGGTFLESNIPREEFE